MLKSRLLWKLLASYAVVVLVATVIVWYLVARRIEQDAVQETEKSLQSQAMLFRPIAAPVLENPSALSIQNRVVTLGKESNTRLTVIRADGVVIADSEADPAQMENHGERLEVQAARSEGMGTNVHFSRTVGFRMMYLAVAVRKASQYLGCVRVSVPLSRVDEELSHLQNVVTVAGLMAIGVGLILGFFFAVPFNRMAATLRKTLTAEQENRTQIEGLLAGERESRARIENLLGNVREATAKLSSASAEILASASQQAAGAREQAAAVSQTVATVDEVTQTADQVAQRAKRVGEAVQRNLESGRTGRKVVEESAAALRAVQEKVESTAENILALAEQAQAIGEITATVTDIAEQTNLLALNAAIEASRAGEQGRGFSVVAGEVRTLADQSKKATAQVRQILGEIQKATSTAVLSTEEVTKGVASATKVADQAGATIKALHDTLGDAAEAAAQIVASASQQAIGMNQIHQAMKNIDQVTRQTSVGMQQAEQAAQNLNALGNQLAELSSNGNGKPPEAAHLQRSGIRNQESGVRSQK
jgi:methyl-accepting chemotaxis protein